MKNDHHTLLNQLFHFLTKHEVMILLVAFGVLLRIPGFFEPYWYGDEGIYLTVGAAMRQGLHLYAQTLDHKTPIIYYLAMVPSQFWFRMLLMIWMSVATVAFYFFTRNLRFKPKQQYLSTFLFVVFTSLPWLEGNIPNGELFVMGFILIGALILSTTQYFQLYLEEKIVPIKAVINKKQVIRIAASGVFFSLAILTKVPALFDVVPFFAIGYFTVVDHFSIRRSRKVMFSIFGFWEILSVAVVSVFLFSVLYYATRGTLQSYIDIGILYNFRYASTWSLPALPFGLSFLFTMPGKLLVVALMILLLTVQSQKLSAKIQFIMVWSVCSLFGALLSSRPYPHYLLQVVPAFSLLIGTWLEPLKFKAEKLVLTFPVILLIGAILGVGFHFYPTLKYYGNFVGLLTHQISEEQYYQSFDALMPDNYRVAAVLKQDNQKRIFIWGTNPTLYALAQKIPTGRFITAFHIADFPGAFAETYQDLIRYQPNYIVVMKSETISFPELFTYLSTNYISYKEFEKMTLYKKADLTERNRTSLQDPIQ